MAVSCIHSQDGLGLMLLSLFFLQGAYYMRMLWYYYKYSTSSNHAVLKLPQVQEAVQIMILLWKAEQKHEEDRYPQHAELLDCLNCNKPYRYPGLPRNGKGSPTNSSTGMSWTGFRPSDDECLYGYLVPANMFAIVALGYVAELATVVWDNDGLAEQARKLAEEMDQGIKDHAIVDHPKYGKMYAFEVDGLGRANLMDDANVPSLLSIPYLGYTYDPEIYANTRRFIFSPDNPTYHKGTNALTGDVEGYGSPHMAAAIPDNIWYESCACFLYMFYAYVCLGVLT
jgi:meiotically up-regulated gene 157 (Mug157) protein